MQFAHQPGDTFIGTAPSGVKWWCYRQPGETEAEHRANCTTMLEALATVQALADLKATYAGAA